MSLSLYDSTITAFLGKPVWKKIKESFGDEVFNDDDTLNREKLGQIIFDDVEKRRILNRITHPVIHLQIYKQVFKYFIRGKNFVVSCIQFHTKNQLER